MTDMIELAQRVCMGEHIPPLKDGPQPTPPAPTNAELIEQAREATNAAPETLDTFADLRRAMRNAGMLP